MVATTETFHNVLQVIQTSCLNYGIELSPFSATIHLKNTSIKERNGNPISYSRKSKTAENAEKKIAKLEKDLLAFKTENNLLRENKKDLKFDTKKIKVTI